MFLRKGSIEICGGLYLTKSNNCCKVALKERCDSSLSVFKKSSTKKREGGREMGKFGGSIIFTVIALVLGGVVGFYSTGTMAGAMSAVMIVAVLGVLETSLSFDNAVVNAKTLAGMTPVWQHRFLTWGMIIAVFGMRVVFPLLIVGIAAHLWPIEAIMLAVKNPAEYERILSSVHAEIAAFGGAFLLMVGIRYFFDNEKDVHWVHAIEESLAKGGKLYMMEAAIVMVALLISAYLLPAEEKFPFLASGIAGLITYAAVQWLEVILGSEEEGHVTKNVASAGLSTFIYLEVLDASFSFDGVIGAFALSNNIFIIALGLGIGAMFVRSLTIVMVDKGTLAEYRYLEHGAFWAILALGAIMFLGLFVEVPEVITGLIGAVLIGWSFHSSIKANRKERVGVKKATAQN